RFNDTMGIASSTHPTARRDGKPVLSDSRRIDFRAPRLRDLFEQPAFPATAVQRMRATVIRTAWIFRAARAALFLFLGVPGVALLPSDVCAAASSGSWQTEWEKTL